MYSDWVIVSQNEFLCQECASVFQGRKELLDIVISRASYFLHVCRTALSRGKMLVFRVAFKQGLYVTREAQQGTKRASASPTYTNTDMVSSSKQLRLWLFPKDAKINKALYRGFPRRKVEGHSQRARLLGVISTIIERDLLVLITTVVFLLLLIRDHSSLPILVCGVAQKKT